MSAAKRAKRPARTVSVHERDVLEYCAQVTSGKIVVGKLVAAAVDRFLHDLQTAESRGFWFDFDDANHTIDFVQLLKHSKGEFSGQFFRLEPWQKFLFWNLFGWKRRSDNTRRFRQAFISVGRGNGKSPLAAAMLNRLMFLDKEDRAELKIAAVERDQARIVFEEAGCQIKSSPVLKKRCQFWKNSVVYRQRQSTIVPLGGEGASKDGFNLHGFVADEVHAWKPEHHELWSKLETAMGKRKQPMSVVITTAGSDRSALWLRLYSLARQVVTGVLQDDSYFVAIYEVDEEDVRDSKGHLRDNFDPACFAKANPNLGISVKPDYLATMNQRAKVDHETRNDLLRYHLNTRVRDGQKVISPAVWSRGAGDLPNLTGKTCHCGLDLGWRDDLASFYECFPLPEQRFALLGWSWIPEQGPRDLQKPPWSHWVPRGRVIVTPGNATDADFIQQHIGEERKRVKISTVSADPNNARTVLLHLVNSLGIKTYEFDQTCRNYNEAVREFLKALSEGRILHGDDPVLAWAADNLVLRRNSAGLVMPDKQRSEEKIDPIVAAIMAFAGCLYLAKEGQQEYRIRAL